MKKNKTNRSGAAAGLSPNYWQNGGKRKRPTGAPTPAGQVNINQNYNPYYTPTIRGLQAGN